MLMGNFCGRCGAALNANTAFCANCGNPLREAPPSPLAFTPAQQQSLPRKSGAAKILISILVVLFIGLILVVSGVVYVGHKVSQKVHQVSQQMLKERNLPPRATVVGDPCRLLSKAEVSRALGIAIIGEQASADGCAYLAEGTSTDFAAKHLSAMMRAHGVDAHQRQMIEKISGTLLDGVQSGLRDFGEIPDGKAAVLTFSVDATSSDGQMTLDRKVLGNLGPASSKIPGVGDEAFDAAGGMLLFRKGDKLVRISYMTCPCTLSKIKPLARKLAAAI
jgi:hypothetical protein